MKNYANNFVHWIGGLSPEEMSDVLEPIVVQLCERATSQRGPRTMLVKAQTRAKTNQGGQVPQVAT